MSAISCLVGKTKIHNYCNYSYYLLIKNNLFLNCIPLEQKDFQKWFSHRWNMIRESPDEQVYEIYSTISLTEFIYI